FTLGQGDALFGPPGEPHAVPAPLAQDGDIEARAEGAAEDRVPLVFHPAGSRLIIGPVLPSCHDHSREQQPDEDERRHEDCHETAPTSLSEPNVRPLTRLIRVPSQASTVVPVKPGPGNGPAAE